MWAGAASARRARVHVTRHQLDAGIARSRWAPPPSGPASGLRTGIDRPPPAGSRATPGHSRCRRCGHPATGRRAPAGCGIPDPSRACRAQSARRSGRTPGTAPRRRRATNASSGLHRGCLPAMHVGAIRDGACRSSRRSGAFIVQLPPAPAAGATASSVTQRKPADRAVAANPGSTSNSTGRPLAGCAPHGRRAAAGCRRRPGRA